MMALVVARWRQREWMEGVGRDGERVTSIEGWDCFRSDYKLVTRSGRVLDMDGS